MGMWQGIVRGMKSAEDRKVRERQMKLAEEQFAEDRRNRRLSFLLDYRKSTRSTSKNASSKADIMQKLGGIGIKGSVAEYLAYSGEGEEILKVHDKQRDAGKLSPSYIPSVIAKVNKQLGDKSSPQALAIATKAALLSGEDMSTKEGQQAGLVEAIYAAQSMEDFKKVDEELIKLMQTSEVAPVDMSLPPIGGLTRGAIEITPTEYKKIRDAVINAVAPTYGEVFVKDQSGQYTINPTKLKEGGAQQVTDLIDAATAGIASDYGSVPFVESLENHTNIAIAQAPDVLKTMGGGSTVNVEGLGVGGGLDVGIDTFGGNGDEEEDEFNSILNERN